MVIVPRENIVNPGHVDVEQVTLAFLSQVDGHEARTFAELEEVAYDAGQLAEKVEKLLP